MAAVTSRLRENGPYVVESDEVRIVDWHGAEYVVERRPNRALPLRASAR
jgi:hypothetical protein